MDIALLHLIVVPFDCGISSALSTQSPIRLLSIVCPTVVFYSTKTRLLLKACGFILCTPSRADARKQAVRFHLPSVFLSDRGVCPFWLTQSGVMFSFHSHFNNSAYSCQYFTWLFTSASLSHFDRASRHSSC